MQTHHRYMNLARNARLPTVGFGTYLIQGKDVDLYLIHAPLPLTHRLEQWRALIKLHPWSQKPDVVSCLIENGISIIAYRSLVPLSG